jgi:hypothetical protein
MVATSVVVLETAELEEENVARPVTSCVEPSLNFAVTEKGKLFPGVMNALVGETAIDCTVADETVTGADPTIFPRLAGLVAYTIADPPGATPVASPAEIFNGG